MKKVLIVEDNIMNQQLFAALLNNSGYEVSQKYDGEDIIADTIAYDPDLILMDIQLPGKNGDELMEMLRRNQRP